MHRATYHYRSLVYHWRTNLAVVLGAAVGTAALTGALLVGDSMRESLKNLALKRLSNVDHALIGARFFEQSLADRINATPEYSDRFDPAYALILLRGGATHAELRTRVDGVGVIGVDQNFWNFHDRMRGMTKYRRAGTAMNDAGATGGLSASAEGGMAKRSAAMNEPRARSERSGGMSNGEFRMANSGSGDTATTSEDRAGNLPAFLDDFTGRVALVNQVLADELRAKPGDAILLRLGKPSAISTETLLGRRDDAVSTLRLTLRGIVPEEYQGQFSLNPAQSTTRNIFVPIDALQRAIDRPGRANAIIVSTQRAASEEGGMAKRSAAMKERGRAGHARQDSERPHDALDPGVAELQTALHRSLTLSDLGLHLRIDNERNYVALESDSILIDPVIEKRIDTLNTDYVNGKQKVFAYLANRITTSLDKPGIPYSTIVAFPLPEPKPISDGTAETPVPRSKRNQELPQTGDGQIVLNQWAASDLDAKVGDDIYVSYYVTDDESRLEEQTAAFTLARIVPLDHEIFGDPGLVPTYPGITDVDRLSDWDAPFPIDFTRIREKDEQYWEEYRTLPKAFIQLEKGQELWAERGDRFGRITSIHLGPTIGGQAGKEAPHRLTPEKIASTFESEFLRETPPHAVGLQFEPVRAQALEAATGSTDFGMLFLGFSFFLIVSAAMLVALLFRLGVERRASEVGLLLATGYERRSVALMLLLQGAALATIGGSIGLVAARAYAWLMLAGLRTWWSDAVGVSALTLAIQPSSLVLGAAAGIAVAMLSIAWALRGLTRMSPRALLAGAVSSDAPSTRSTSRKRSAIVAVIALAAAVALVAYSFGADAQAQAGAFFGAGAATLVALLATLRRWLHSGHATPLEPGQPAARTRLGIRNAPRNPGRSLLTAGLIASATFVIASIQAFRIEADPSTWTAKSSGSGGFNLYAESAAPLPYDLSQTDGQSSLGLDDETQRLLNNATILPLRLRPGDESSCLNLYRPTEPRILAASQSFIEHGGFAFSATLARTDAQRQNPWLLLNSPLPDGAIPVIGDEAAVKWQLHRGLGQDLIIDNERGQPVTLRFVALLKQSFLQDELILAESDFLRLFPSITGRSFFLMSTSVDAVDETEQTLEQALERFGFDVRRSADRLNRFLAVQNTYLATFRNLGGLGLLLGTTGLGAVLLRNVWERRRELALLRAVGFDRMSIGWMVLAENLFLLVAGMGAGIIASVVAIAPTATAAPGSIPWLSLAATLSMILVIGCLVCVVAGIPTLRAPLVQSLRSE